MDMLYELDVKDDTLLYFIKDNMLFYQGPQVEL
jgi:hypothetical protein